MFAKNAKLGDTQKIQKLKTLRNKISHILSIFKKYIMESNFVNHVNNIYVMKTYFHPTQTLHWPAAMEQYVLSCMFLCVTIKFYVANGIMYPSALIKHVVFREAFITMGSHDIMIKKKPAIHCIFFSC